MECSLAIIFADAAHCQLPTVQVCVCVMAGRGLQLVPAGAPELVRGDQKDRFYSSYVGSLVADVFHPLLPLRYVLRWEREFQLIAELWYYGLTTVCGNQTLGEEYCNIVQVGPGPRESTLQHTQFSVPSFLRRTTAVFLQVLGPYILEKALGWLGQRVRDRNLSLSLSHRQYGLLETALETAEDLASLVHLLHLGLFYIRGLFHRVGKRLTGIKYLAVSYETRENYQSARQVAYRLLGWLVLCQLAVKLLVLVRKLYRLWKGCGQPREEVGGSGIRSTVLSEPRERTERSVRLKCPLCLEPCCNVTATRCGHLFCWQCVAEWARDRRECPVCRATVEPQTLVALQHFAV